MILGRNDGVRTRAVGDAQAGAQVVRIGHAVEHEQQRRIAAPLRRSFTSDQGREMTRHAELSAQTGVKVYF